MADRTDEAAKVFRRHGALGHVFILRWRALRPEQQIPLLCGKKANAKGAKANAEGAKVNAEGAKVNAEGAKVNAEGAKGKTALRRGCDVA
ncbi:hypothetical protein [Edaphobacter bradus]|uniref:hypothetical protein n=1 Tax=Edaphobacter bradus TaxID=2259016 RepID=UPI0021E0E74B|nr:hypothetical protein [Edaphobacter bradus]